jgi:hypothetical protein
VSSKGKVQLSDFDFDEDEEVSPLQAIAKNSNLKQSEKHTDNIRKTTGKPTDIIYGNSTDNIRKTTGSKSNESNKPTDKPTDDSTDNIRKTTGKPTDINCLVGLQRLAFFWLVREAKEFGFSDPDGNRITQPINGNTFTKSVDFKSYKQAKDVLYELKVTGFLKTHFVKNGRGGFVQYLIEKDLYQEVLLNESKAKPTDNIRKTTGKPTGKSTDKPTDEGPYSSSIYNNITTIENGDAESLSHWVFSVDSSYFPESVIETDFKLANNIKQAIIRTGVTETDFWSYLSAFDYDVNDPHCKKKPNAKILYSCFLNGNPYTSERYKQALSYYKKVHEDTKKEFVEFNNPKDPESVV